MSRIFNTEAFENLTALWDNQTTDPNSLASIGGLGSVWVRNGNYPTIPTEIYFKESAANVAGNRGWVKQNLTGLKVFNITKAPYNCVGDGVTSCVTGITQAITDAQAAGGGIIYFPPAPLGYAIYRVPGQLGIFEIVQKSNLVFLGDGYSSLLKMTGDFGATDTYAFRIANQSQRIAFLNFRISAITGTNPSPSQQNHHIDITQVPTDAGPPHDIDIEQMWFDPNYGAAVRMVGLFAAGGVITNVRIAHCAFNMANDATSMSRSCIEGNRASVEVIAVNNWMAPVGTVQLGQHIDFEPAGAVAPTAWIITGNIINGTNPIAVTLSGISAVIPASQNIFSRNIMLGSNGGTIEAAGSLSDVIMTGNVVTIAGDSSGFSVIELRNATQVLIGDNVLYSLDSTGHRSAIKTFEDGGNPSQCNISGNACQAITAAPNNVVGISVEDPPEFSVRNNLVLCDLGATAGSSGIQFRSSGSGLDYQCVANLVIATVGAFLRGLEFTTGAGVAIHNVCCNDNLVDGSSSAILFDASGAAFLDWRSAEHNNCPNSTVNVVFPPSTNVGVTHEGTAGSNAQMAVVGTTPSGNVSASTGSLLSDTAGGVGTTLWVKESGTGTAGWVSDGPSELQFGAQANTTATAARFFAPGFALATETTVEIKYAMPRACSIRNFRIRCIAGTGGGNNTVTFRKNGVNTSTGLTISNTAAAAGPSTTATAFAAGDLISLQETKAVAPTTPQTQFVVTVEITG